MNKVETRNLRIQRNRENRSLGDCALVAKVDFSLGSNKNLQHIIYENHAH
jgi:hypothetical protein